MEVGTQLAWIAREFTKHGHEVIVADTKTIAMMR